MSSPASTNVATSAIFTPSGGSPWTISDLVEQDDGETASVTKVTTDAAQTVNGMYVDSIEGNINVTATDMENTTNAGAVIGTTGSLAIKYTRRAAGKGGVSGHGLTVTYANAQLHDIRRHAGVTGTGTITFVFGAYDPAGSAVKSAAVA